MCRREYVRENRIYTKEQVKEKFETKVQKFIQSLEEKGVQIIEKDVTINKTRGIWRLKVDFTADEKTGILQKITQEPLENGQEE